MAGPGATAAQDSFKVDPTVGTGTQSRYERLAAVDTREYYGDWHGRDSSSRRYG